MLGVYAFFEWGGYKTSYRFLRSAKTHNFAIRSFESFYFTIQFSVGLVQAVKYRNQRQKSGYYLAIPVFFS